MISGNDTMAKGAAAALKAAGKKAVVGLDDGPEAIDAIEAGAMDATVLQPAVRMRRAAVAPGNAPGRENRAIAGLSMGGMPPLAISFLLEHSRVLAERTKGVGLTPT